MATTYDKASLVMIPSGYKDDKLYSVKPTDGSGDFTFSRDGAGASPATRVNASGLIEKGRENILTYSNDFSNVAWTKVLSSVTGGQSGYDGSNNAWLLSKSAAGGRVQQIVSVSNVNTFSVYAKAGTDSWIATANPTSGAYFDLANGVVGSVIGTGVIDHSIESIGGGWYRCSVVHSSAVTNIQIYVADADLDVNGTSGNIYIQDAQLEQGLVATDYIETTTAAVSAGLLGDMPRLDYSGGATCPSLLLEPSRVNQAAHSEYFNTYSATRLSVTANSATSPEGVTNATKLTPDTTYGTHYFIQTNNVTSGQKTTISFFAKADGYNFIRAVFSSVNGAYPDYYQTFDLSDGSKDDSSGIDSADIEPMGNGWYRCTATATAAASVLSSNYLFVFETSGNAAFAGNGTSGVLIYGLQVETNASYPTSYIPTYGSASTRAADSALGSFNGDGIFASNWTAFCELVVPYEATTSGSAAGFTLRAVEGSTTNSNWSALLAHSSSTELTFNLYNGVSVDTNVFTYTWNTTLKIAVRYDGAYFINGTKYTSSVTPQEPVEFSFGRAGQANSSAGETAEIKQSLAFPTALTDAECISLTTL